MQTIERDIARLQQKHYRIPFQWLLVLLLLVAATVPQTALSSESVPVNGLLRSTVETRIVSLITPERVRSLVDEAAASWVEGNAKAFAALFAPDGEFVVPGQKVVGLAAIEQMAAEFAHSHSHVSIKIQRILLDGQQAVVEWQWEDRENSTGKRTQVDDAIVVDFANGQIKRWREYIDSTTPRKAV